MIAKSIATLELTSRLELPNLLITNEVLYLLSYVSICACQNSIYYFDPKFKWFVAFFPAEQK